MMFAWLVNKFIPFNQDTSNIQVRERYGTLCSILSIVCNAFMVVFKLVFGFITNSVAIQADGFNNLSDMGSNIATFFGFKLAGKHPDANHPYGHGRYEYIAGLIISFLILLVGFSSLKESVFKIIRPEELNFQIGAVVALVVSILIKLWMASFNRKTGQVIDSPSLKAAAQDSLNDVLTTLATLISLVLSLFMKWPVDGIIGTLVSIFVLKSGIEIFKDTVNPLLGQAPDKQLIDDIQKHVLSYEHVIGIHDFMLHDYGPGRQYMTFHAEVDSRENIVEIHDEIDTIEREMLEKYDILTTIHMDPIDMDDELTNSIKKEVIKIIKDIHQDYSIHDFRIVSGSTHTNLIFDVLIPSSDQIDHDTLIEKIERQVQKLNKTYYCVIQIDHSFV